MILAYDVCQVLINVYDKINEAFYKFQWLQFCPKVGILLVRYVEVVVKVVKVVRAVMVIKVSLRRTVLETQSIILFIDDNIGIECRGIDATGISVSI